VLVLGVCSLKGGVGKTSVTLGLASAALARGVATLVIDLDPQCDVPGLVLNQPKKAKRVDAILNNSFGMLGINSTLIISRHRT